MSRRPAKRLGKIFGRFEARTPQEFYYWHLFRVQLTREGAAYLARRFPRDGKRS